MADMPSNQYPSPRPSPPARNRGWGSHSLPQQEDPGPRTSDAQFLRPNGIGDLSPGGRGTRSSSRGERGSPAGQFGTSRDEFSFTDEEGGDTHNSRGRGNRSGYGRQASGGNRAVECEEEEELGELEEAQDDEDDDYYSILNVPSKASVGEIRTAYHSLSRRFHPDKQPPDMRDRATKHFNKVLVAYETLISPQKRMIYDQLGIPGLKDKTWQLGVRSMTPEQFKFWLQENMRKTRAEKLDELVVSHGKVSAVFDVSGFWFRKLILVQDEEGKIVSKQLRSYPTGVMTQYQVSHAFHVPLDSLADIFEKPVPSSFKELWQEDLDQPRKPPKRDAPRAVPMLSLDFSLGGAPLKKKASTSRSLPASVLAGTNLTAGLVHSFPNLPSDSPRSIASLLAGNQVVLQATILPTPMVTTQVLRSFGQNAVSARATFVGLPSIELAPITECSFTRRLAVRHSVAIGVNTGGVTWLQGLRDVFKLPEIGQVRKGFASLSYIYHPIGSAIAEAEEAGGGSDTKKSPAQRTGRSKRTEAYTVTLNTGHLARGVQVKFSWGRTFFVGTPVGEALLQCGSMKPASVGIRLGVDATVHITGATQYTLKASRKIFENTVIGLHVSCGGTTGLGGIQISLLWSRLGQKISVPVIIAPIPDSRVMTYSTAIPLLTYVAAEFFWLRPRDRKIRERETARLRRALRSKTLRRRRAAAEAVEVMRASVERKMDAERAVDGLVVLAATYGKAMDGCDQDTKLVADVTVAVAALVEQGQLSLSKGIDKSKIIGFYDPAPGSEKVLWIRYLFGGFVHEVSVKGRQGVAAPLRSHLVPGQA